VVCLPHVASVHGFWLRSPDVIRVAQRTTLE